MLHNFLFKIISLIPQFPIFGLGFDQVFLVNQKALVLNLQVLELLLPFDCPFLPSLGLPHLSTLNAMAHPQFLHLGPHPLEPLRHDVALLAVFGLLLSMLTKEGD